jgi:hypothetical protein
VRSPAGVRTCRDAASVEIIMQSDLKADTEVAPDWPSRSGRAAGVEGLSGRIRLNVGDTIVGRLNVASNGAVEILPDGEAEASLIADTPQTLVGLLGGEKHPVVARLQGQISTSGDTAFAIRTFLGLQAGSPWSGLVPRS